MEPENSSTINISKMVFNIEKVLKWFKLQGYKHLNVNY